eukprot:1183014-Prorocentrum_minimum.AAC.1
MTLDEPAKPSPVVATRRHGRGTPGPNCSSWCSHRAHPPSGAGYSSLNNKYHTGSNGQCRRKQVVRGLRSRPNSG